MKRLQRQVALVTGGASASGAAIAQALHDAGMRVVLSDIDAAAGSTTAARLGAEWMLLDVRQELGWIAVMARLLDSHGRLDLLVNQACAGSPAARAQDPEHTRLADWQAVQHQQLDGVFLACKHGLRAMRRGGGGTILIADGAAAGAAAQAAVRAHTRSVARYCAEQELAVRCLRLRHGTPAAMAAMALRLAVG